METNSDHADFTKEAGLPAPPGAHMVDCRANARLMREEVSFHWWNDRSTTLHYHNYYEIFLITRGRATHRLNGGETALRRNTLHLIRPSDAHQFVATRAESCTHMNLLVLPQRLAALCGALNIPFEAVTSGAPLRTVLSDAETAFFLDRAEQINLCGRHYDDASRLILEMLAEALALLYRRRPHPAGADDWFAELLRTLRSPEYLTLRASDVYALCPCSAPVLIRRFRAEKGCTVVQYLTRVKMDYAQSFLRSTNFPVREIASRLGYDSTSHFCHVFKEHAGKTPQEYRLGAQKPE
ncbi:MAG: AraC family transcriptional regulator [Clostridiales bacterium]|nr:AraC family transcriptional regulator [Clostridiales bacterium]